MLGMAQHFTGCAANANSDGSCKRTCGSRPVGGGRYKGVALDTAETWKCTAGTQLPQRTFHFLVYEETSSASATTSDPKSDVPKRIPVAGVNFTALSVPMTGTDGSSDLDTPTSEMCTDSCGVAQFSFTPVCASQDLNVSIYVPGMVFDDTFLAMPATKFSVETN
jgi:hypothetical protein